MSRNPVHLGPRAAKHLTMTEIGAPASGPGSEPRQRYKADPTRALHPAADPRDFVPAMTAGRTRHWMGSGDRRATVQRPGAEDANRLPSRVGSMLRWPDGRVTPIDPSREEIPE